MSSTTVRQGAAAASLSLGSGLVFWAGTFLYWVALYVYTPILPLYAQEAGASLAAVGWIVGAYAGLSFLSRLPMGIWSDRLGRRKPFIVGGLLASALGCLLFVVVPQPLWMVVGRALIGIGGATWVTIVVLFSGYFPEHRQARAMSLIVPSCGMAQAVAVVAGGWLAGQVGSAAPFLAGAAAALAGAACLATVPDAPPGSAAAVHVADLWRVARVPSLVVVAVLAGLSHFSFAAVTYGFLPLYARSIGASQATLGLLLAAALVLFGVGTYVGAGLAARFGRPAVLAASFVLGAGVGLSPLVGDLLLLGLLQAAAGLGFGLGIAITMSLAAESVPAVLRGTALGLFQTIYAVGFWLGPTLAGMVAERAGVGAVFPLAAAASLLGLPIVLAAARRPAR